jgi:glycine/betaine/sarcosine/D-proline reductase family selenoprotein B
VGIPVAFCSAIPTIPLAAGVPRVIHGKAVPYLLGDPSLPGDREYALREGLTSKALATLSMEIAEPTVFAAGG